MSEHIASDDAPAPRHVRLQVELVMEVTDAAALTAAALDQIASDGYLPDDERTHARDAVRRDEAEALAYLIDPFDLVSGVPGVELAQASWNSARIDYDPEDDEWDFYEDDGTDSADPGADAADPDRGGARPAGD
jgi:hypothetical protein